MAKITFVIERLNFFKNVGGVIDQALKRGHKVNILYDQTKKDLKIKGLQAASPKLFPKFLHGTPNVKPFSGIENLSDCAKTLSDVVVLHCGAVSDYEQYLDKPKTYPFQYQSIRKSSIPVVSLYSHFYDNCLLQLNAYSSVDLTCLLSEYSVKLHKQVLLKNCNYEKKKRSEYKKEIEQVMNNNTVVTGSALFDLFDDFYHKHSHNNTKQNIILFHPKFMYRDCFMDIFGRYNSRLLSAAISLFYYKGKYFFRTPTYPQYKKIIKQIDKISKKNQYNIITKSRPKHGKQHEKFLKTISHQYLTGENDKFYPEYTSMQILENAKLCVHIRTSSVIESVIAGIPSIHIQIPMDNSSKRYSEHYRNFLSLFRSCKPDTIFNYQGCVWNIPWENSLAFFDQFDSKAIEQDPERRARYIRYYCGVENESASKRQMDAIEKLIK